MEAKVRCNKCQEIQTISERILTREWVRIREQNILVMYYKCIKCGTLHIVQLDDKHTVQELNELKELIGKIAITRAKGYEPKRKVLLRMDKLRKYVRRDRRRLNRTFNGSVVNLSGNNIIIQVEMQED